jgi:hypothetical protein
MLWVRAIPGVQPPWRPASAGAGDGKAIPNHKSRRQIGDCRYTVRPKPNDGRAKISKFIGTNAGLRNFYVCVRVTVLRRLAVARRQQPWSITGGETGPGAADTQAAGACRRMEWDTRRALRAGLGIGFQLDYLCVSHDRRLKFVGSWSGRWRGCSLVAGRFTFQRLRVATTDLKCRLQFFDERTTGVGSHK